MNRAAILGPDRFSWWPDWRNQCAAIVAGGPSVKRDEVGKLKDRIHIIAIKESYDLCPWAEVVYGCDAPWWIHRKGLAQFPGVKITHGVQASNQFKDIHRVEINMSTDSLLTEQPMMIGNGGNSGHQALSLAVQFGATEILLMGYDMGADPNHLHWYGRNKWLNANNPATHNFNRWIKGFEAANKDIKRLGINVVNASPISKINCFKKAGLEETLIAWGL